MVLPVEMRKMTKKAYEEWERLDKEFTIPYYPHVSIGWDNSPRTWKSAVTRENTPERFEQALRKAKAYLDARPNLHPLITINSWNEWTETNYLQPDDVYGYGYLNAVKNVFVDDKWSMAAVARNNPTLAWASAHRVNPLCTY